MSRTILHLDADAFFASVEQSTDARLRGKPIAVGGEKRGIIASASYEARKFGVFTPMPTVRARKLDAGVVQGLEAWATAVTLEGERLSFRVADAEVLPDVLRYLVARGADVYEFTPERQSLEELFLNQARAGPDVKNCRARSVMVGNQAKQQIKLLASQRISRERIAVPVRSPSRVEPYIAHILVGETTR